MRTLTCLLLLSLTACGSNDVPGDDGGQDAPADSSKPDAGQKDSSSDTGTADTGTDATTDDSGMDAGLDGSISLDGGGSDSGIVCGSKMGTGFQGMGQCGATETYKCVNDKYDIDCQCPAATCTCKKNGQSVMTLNNINGCPQCNFSFSTLAAQCGFPY